METFNYWRWALLALSYGLAFAIGYVTCALLSAFGRYEEPELDRRAPTWQDTLRTEDPPK